MTEGGITNAIVIAANAGLALFLCQALLLRIVFVKRKNADKKDYSLKNHVNPRKSLKLHGLLNNKKKRLPAAMFVRDGASMELLFQPSADSDPGLEREILAVRIAFRNGGYAFWATDADLKRAPCKNQGPGKTRMAFRLVFGGDPSSLRNFVVCETSEAMNRATISAVKHKLLPEEELGSPAWCRRVYNCGPDIYREPEVFRKELVDSLMGTGAVFKGKAGINFGSTHKEQARRPWFIVLFATENGFGFAGTAIRSEIVGCVWYELGFDLGEYLEVFRGNRPLSEDLANIVIRLSKDLSCFDHRYDPRVIDEACMATTRCQLMICYEQKGHYQIGRKKKTVKKSNVHGRFWTPPITSCETAEVLREYGYDVLTPEGPAAEHGGGPHSLFFGVANWTMGEDRKLYERVREPLPKPEPREDRVVGKPSRPGWRDRRKMKILSGTGYAVKTPRKEVPVLKSKTEGDLIGERIMVLWEKGSHPDTKKTALYCGVVQAFNAKEGTHHIIYDDFSQEDEHLDELKYKLKKDGKWEWVTGPKWKKPPRAAHQKRGRDSSSSSSSEDSSVEESSPPPKKRRTQAQAKKRKAAPAPKRACGNNLAEKKKAQRIEKSATALVKKRKPSDGQGPVMSAPLPKRIRRSTLAEKKKAQWVEKAATALVSKRKTSGGQAPVFPARASKRLRGRTE